MTGVLSKDCQMSFGIVKKGTVVDVLDFKADLVQQDLKNNFPRIYELLRYNSTDFIVIRFLFLDHPTIVCSDQIDINKTDGIDL